MPAVPTKNRKQVNLELPAELVERIDRVRGETSKTDYYISALEAAAERDEKKLSRKKEIT